MRILTDQIRIYQVRESTWALEVVWQPTFQFTFARVRLRLDPSMIALPPQSEEYRGLVLSIGLSSIAPEIPLNETYPWVSENGKTVEFSLHMISLRSLQSLRSKVAKTILFQWLDSSSLPKQVEITLEISQPPKSKETLNIIGYNVKESLIEFAAARRDSRFHFPSDEAALRIDPATVYESTPLLSSLETTTIWGVSGPHEVWFWQTKRATEYLVGQISKLKTKGPVYQPIRVSLCPYDAESDAKTRRAFLAEMQVQHECGVNVRMIDQKTLESVTGDSDVAIAVFGDALGVMLHGIRGTVDEAYLLLALDQARLHELKERFIRLYNESLGWDIYKRSKAVKFSKRAMQAIASRRDGILDSVRHS